MRRKIGAILKVADAMMVTVHLHTILQQETPDGLRNRLSVGLPPGSTLGDLVTHLDLPLGPESLLLAVNGRHATMEKILNDGDHINLMPAISGG